MGSFWVRVAGAKWRGGSVEDVKCCSRKVETGGRTSKVWGSMISAGQIFGLDVWVRQATARESGSGSAEKECESVGLRAG